MTRIDPHALLQRWADGHPPAGAAERFLAAGLRTASLGWWAGAAARSIAFDLGWKRSASVPCPVYSIGNLSVGGTGKTPVVMLVARCLQQAGRRVAVVSRGYRRAGGSAPRIVSDADGLRLAGPEAGDEPLMMARQLPGVAVVVGARRLDAARIACSECGADAIVLDDGFQHRALARDCDIVLWDTLRPFGSAALLPRGFLREGLGALRRAHALVFTRANLGRPTRPLVARIKRIAPGLLVFHASLVLGAPYLPGRPGEAIPVADLPTAIGAFCGLGNPESFWKTLAAAGRPPVWKHAFPDHHRPGPAELDRLLGEARCRGAELVLLTEKDAENLPPGWTPPLPLRVAPAVVSLGEDRERFEDFLRNYLDPRGAVETA